MTATSTSSRIGGLTTALPFALSLGVIPLSVVAAIYGGWLILLLPILAWHLSSIMDFALGQQNDNPDAETPQAQLFWYKAITLVWPPLQMISIFGVLGYVISTGHLNRWEQWGLFAVLGISSGTIGVNYAHELMHQQSKLERWFADALLASVLYAHFRSEHLLVHHRHVGTPADPVTARYGESFYRFFPRVLIQSLISSFNAEKSMLARKGLPWHHASNPFWRYLTLQAGFVLLAALIGGWWGVFLFSVQAFWAVFQLELVNYVEHYGLTRKHLGDGKYENVQPHHSWNATQRASNWLLLNLQRHSDHHYKPNRRFPLLQTYDEETAPQLPYGYPLMTMLALLPSPWRKVMHPRVRTWRKLHYPEIKDWTPYKRARNPVPK